jgi:hypothetical protein
MPQQFLAKAPARRDGQCRVIGNVGDAVQVGYLAVHKITHEEGRRQAHATELFETAY